MTRKRKDPDDTPQHVCGRCRTPYGPSVIPCPNEIAKRAVANAVAAATQRITHPGRTTR